MKPRTVQPPKLEVEPENGTTGPLWNTIRQQLYPSEVNLVKRLVGQGLIKENQLMWDELASLQQMLSELQTRNDSLLAKTPQAASAARAPSLHRELLRQQVQVLLQDAQSQASASGLALADLVPSPVAGRLRDLLPGAPARAPSSPAGPATPSTRPSTRPSSAGGLSGCGAPEQLASAPVLPAGRCLGVEELGAVAEGVREALEEERSALLAAIARRTRLLAAEDERRLALAGGGAERGAPGEPSTEELQELVHALQDAITKFPSTSGRNAAEAPVRARTAGGAQVRRLKALIEQSRHQTHATASLPEALQGIPEIMGALSSPGSGVGPCKPFDPFFDDPFAA